MASAIPASMRLGVGGKALGQQMPAGLSDLAMQHILGGGLTTGGVTGGNGFGGRVGGGLPAQTQRPLGIPAGGMPGLPRPMPVPAGGFPGIPQATPLPAGGLPGMPGGQSLDPMTVYHILSMILGGGR